MSEPEIIAFIVRLAATFAVSLAATLVIVHRAVAPPPKAELTVHFLVVWGATWGARSAQPRQQVPQRRRGDEGAAERYFAGLTGQMDGGSKLCDASANGSCDNAWGLGAILLSLAAALGHARLSARDTAASPTSHGQVRTTSHGRKRVERPGSGPLDGRRTCLPG